MTPEQTQCFLSAIENMVNAIASETDPINQAVVRSGLTFLWLARESNGYLNLSHDEAMTVCGTDKNGTMRRHLIQLQKSGVLQSYSTNGTVRMKFAGYAGRELVVHQRGNSVLEIPNSVLEIPEDSENSENCDPHARLRALQYLLRAHQSQFNRNFDETAPSKLVSKLDPTNFSETSNLLTASPDPVEHALTVAFLLAAGFWPKTAKQLADRHPFDLIRRAVGHWWCNRRSKGGQFDERPGIVITWLTNLEETVIPPLSAEFMASTLYLNHRRKSEMIVDDINDGATETDDELDTTQNWPEMNEYWAVALERMREKLPAGTFNTWLEGSRAEFSDKDYSCVVVVDSVTKRDYLQSRLWQMISREINKSTGYKLTLSIEARRRS